MRIVVAGGGGFASLLVHELSQTPHAILVLSQSGRPELEELYDCQVAMVDYHNTDALRFLLQGVNLVISTIPGVEQLSLIEASRAARVDRFIPSEFEGLVSQRPMPEHDPYISKGSAEARALLRRYSRSKSAPLNYTVFSCGMFYERFGPGGLQARGMGASFEILGQRDCMIDIDHGYAQVPTTGPDGRAIHIALTSAYDVARLVVAALDLGISNWPHEFKMYGTRLPSVQLSQICSETMGVPLDVRPMSYEELLLDLQLCSSDPDRLIECISLQHLLQTATGRYFMTSDGLLNTRLSMRLTTFHEWLRQVRGMH